jgi:DNA ligase-associated putative exonuclease
MTAVETWLMPTAAGLYCAPGDFYIDPPRKVARALITHGHSDHARAGHGHVLATAETIAIMQVRYGRASAGRFEAVHLGRPQSIHGVSVRFVPAGHILGSAQIVLEWAGKRVVVSGDYKRAADPTCLPFELVPCDVFVTEATFALPVFRHGPVEAQIDRLLRSMAREPGRAHLVGAYGLGKCQRLLKVLRQAGYDRPIYLHDTHVPLTQLYEHLGQHFGDVRRATDAPADRLRQQLVRALRRRSRHRVRVRVDAGAGPRPPSRRGPATGHLRSCRLARADRHHRGNGGGRCLDHAWPRRCAGACARGHGTPGACVVVGRAGGRGGLDALRFAQTVP